MINISIQVFLNTTPTHNQQITARLSQVLFFEESLLLKSVHI